MLFASFDLKAAFQKAGIECLRVWDIAPAVRPPSVTLIENLRRLQLSFDLSASEAAKEARD